MSNTSNEQKSTEAAAPGRKRASRLGRTARIITVILATVLVCATGSIAYYYVASPTLRYMVRMTLSGADAPEEAFPGQDQIDILLMGRDVDRDRHGRIVHTHGRSDVMILAHIDFRKNSVNLLSIPRDTLVHIPGCRGKYRISSANARGGPELARKTVARLLGVQPDYYLMVNFEGFEKAIDAVGGLVVAVDKRLDYDDNWGGLHIHLKPGTQLLSGEQAMGFVRYRQSNDGDAESDLVRIGRQQELLRAARAKLSLPQVAFKVPKTLDKIYKDVESDLTSAQIMCMAKFLRSLPGSGLQIETLPALEGGGVYVRADLDATRNLVDRMFFDNQR